MAPIFVWAWADWEVEEMVGEPVLVGELVPLVVVLDTTAELVPVVVALRLVVGDPVVVVAVLKQLLKRPEIIVKGALCATEPVLSRMTSEILVPSSGVKK